MVLATSVTFARAADAPAATPGAAKPASVVLKSYHWNRWLVQETRNFRVICLPGAPEAKRFPEVCEALRTQLQQTWFGESEFGKSIGNWTPRCDIVLYPNVSEYSRVLGPGSEQSSGCASLNMDKGRITSRRVDLRADAADWLHSALPHELTHVIVADRFSKKQLPRWADEGMSILAEPEAKRNRRAQELQRAVANRAVYHAADLVQVKTYPAAQYRDAFYGQSASLVSYLLEQDTPERFLDFLERAMETDYDTALKEVYGVKSMATLQAHWQPRLFAREQASVLLADRITRITATMEAGQSTLRAQIIPD